MPTVIATADAPIPFAASATATVTVRALASAAIPFTASATATVTDYSVTVSPIAFTAHATAGRRSWRVRAGTTCHYRDASDVVHHAIITSVTHQTLVDLRVGRTAHANVAAGLRHGSGAGFYR